MSKKNRNAAIERKINTVKAAALAVKSDEDDIPDQLFDDVEWIVDRSKEHKLYDLLDNPILTAPARKSIEFALVEAGYRYYSFAQDIKTKEETLAVVLPFAVLFTIIASTGISPLSLMEKQRRQ